MKEENEMHQCAAAEPERYRTNETEGDFYSPEVTILKDGALRIDVGGTVITRPIREWFAAMDTHAPSPALEWDAFLDDKRKVCGCLPGDRGNDPYLYVVTEDDLRARLSSLPASVSVEKIREVVTEIYRVLAVLPAGVTFGANNLERLSRRLEQLCEEAN